MTLILGIETSCDETAAAVVEDGQRIISSIVASQIDIHRRYGGVFPEVASRQHVLSIMPVIEEAMNEAGVSWDALEAVAVTYGPGLAGSLLVGVNAAKGIALGCGLPLLGINHIEAHIYANWLGKEEEDSIVFPVLCLVVSGGHTELILMSGHGQYQRLGGTLDDAAGEAFDKVASILELGYPGGPVVERSANVGDPGTVDFPRTMLGADSLDFSFSGIKTAVLYHVHGHGRTSGGLERLSRQNVADIAASFQQAVIDVLVRKTLLAAEKMSAQTIVAGGGVIANRALRRRLEQDCREAGVALHLPPMHYCTDNAAMVAALGYQLFVRGHRVDLSVSALA